MSKIPFQISSRQANLHRETLDGFFDYEESDFPRLFVSVGDRYRTVAGYGAGRTVVFLQRRAEAGDPKAQNELGVRYRVGDGVEKDEAKAFDWYRRAAKQGFALAYFNLGTAFYNGDGVSPNDGFACAWFLLSAEGGEPSGKAAYERVSASHENSGGAGCEVLAGDAYINGTEIPQNLAKGLDLYTKAADAGNGAAALRIAYLHMKGNNRRIHPESLDAD